MMRSNGESSDYADFIGSRELASLVRTNHTRIDEEVTRGPDSLKIQITCAL